MFATISQLRRALILCIGWSLAMCSLEATELSAEEKAAGWRLLFDGKTTEGWRSFGKSSFPEKGWRVLDGVLHLEPGSKAGDIVTESTFDNFELSWEWKLPKGANNGVKYFVLEERGQAIGHEYQMIDDAIVKDPRQGTAAFYDVLPPSAEKPLKVPGEWNHSRIRVQGNQVEHWLNGEKVLEYQLSSPEVLKAVANSKFKSVKDFGTKVRGRILLTYHNDEVSYRNIKVRELK